MNIAEKYRKLEDQAKVDYLLALKKLKEDQEIEQKLCVHDFQIFEELFYAAGMTAPGKLCKNCGTMMHLTTEERNVWYAEKRKQ